MEFVYRQTQFVPCYRPLTGYFGKEVNPATGRRRIVFNASDSFSGIGVELPCGKCVGCMLERSRQWALRIESERRMHVESAFLTLTYCQEKLPRNGSLEIRELQLFMKRLRKQREQGLRFFACGEYGSVTSRPHYHVLLLNTSFPDRLFWKNSGEHPLFVSAELSSLWTLGEHFIGDVSFRSAAYVARYCTKKLRTEVLNGRSPEFIAMSRRPGIGLYWYEEYGAQAYKWDSAVVDGREVPLTRYYDGKYAEKVSFSSVYNPKVQLPELRDLRDMSDKTNMEVLKRKRRRKAVMSPDNTPERRRVRERVAELNRDRFEREK